MKKCSSCHQDKPETEFYKKGKSGKLNSLCKACFNDYCQQRWIKRKKQAIEYLGGKCAYCGYNTHYAPMQFHHLARKDFSWDQLRVRKWQIIAEELEKCLLLCTNCHSIIHSLDPVVKGPKASVI